MIEIPMGIRGAYKQDTLLAMGSERVEGAYTAQNILSLNDKKKEQTGKKAPLQPVRPIERPMPKLSHVMQKGQKVSLAALGALPKVEIRLGWKTSRADCEVDVSAFLLGENGKVIGDDWFVFYGQSVSPDGSTSFVAEDAMDKEMVLLDVNRLHRAVKKIVFVLTIHEALEKGLHFGMVRDAYIRILEQGTQKELVSFQMTEYYDNVISMMIGELYLYKDVWKFHGIGNGVARDLAGLCALYGVQVSG